MKHTSFSFVALLAILVMPRFAPALGGDCSKSAPVVTVLASTKAGTEFASIGPASISADASRVVFKAVAHGQGDRIYQWSPGSAPEQIAAVNAHIAALGGGPDRNDEVFLGGPVLQRIGSHIAYTTQLNQVAPQVWTLDLDDPAAEPQLVATGSPGESSTLLGQLSIDNAGDLSFWKLACDASGCVQQILDSLDPADPIAIGTGGVTVIGPSRAPAPPEMGGPGATLYLRHESGALSLHRSGLAEPIYTATTVEEDIGIISSASINNAAVPGVAVFIDDPIGLLATPGIYRYDLDTNAIAEFNLVVRLDGEVNGPDGFKLLPPLTMRFALNDNDDLAFTAIDITDEEPIEKLFVRLNKHIVDLIAVSSDVIDGGEVLGDIEALGVTNRDGSVVTVLFRVMVGSGGAEGGETWSVLGLICATVPDACPWDLTGNGFVGVADLLVLLSAWGPNPGHPADFTGEGVVGVADLIQLLANWGPCP